jgi:hypothetical protein
LEKKCTHRAGDARGRIAEQSAGVSPSMTGCIEPCLVPSLQLAADEIVKGVDITRMTKSRILGVSIRPITGECQEIAIVSELAITRDRGGNAVLDATGQSPCLSRSQHIRELVRSIWYFVGAHFSPERI